MATRGHFTLSIGRGEDVQQHLGTFVMDLAIESNGRFVADVITSEDQAHYFREWYASDPVGHRTAHITNADTGHTFKADVQLENPDTPFRLVSVGEVTSSKESI